jgi:hypothetical protein
LRIFVPDYKTSASQELRCKPTRSRPLRIATAAGVLWLGSILGWSSLLAKHQFRPGTVSTFKQDWPQASRLHPSPDSLTIVVFAHPECPCLSATLTETERLQTLLREPCRLFVVFADDPAFDLLRSRHFRRVSDWKNAVVVRDADKHEIALFGARTSGQVFIFDKDRRLLFSGGITESRAHEGDNPNLERAVAAGRSHAPNVVLTRVYGCSLR